MQIIGHLPVDREHCGEIGILFTGERTLRNDGAEDHGEDIHQDHAGQIIKIEFQRAHAVFYMPSDHVEEIEEYQFQKTASGLGENIGHKPPDLSLQDLALVKTQQLVQKAASVHHTQEGHDAVAKAHIQHQIRDAFVSVSSANSVYGEGFEEIKTGVSLKKISKKSEE